MSPVAHEVHDNGKHSHKGDSSLLHAAISLLSQADVEGATGVGIGIDLVAFIAEREGQERST